MIISIFYVSLSRVVDRKDKSPVTYCIMNPLVPSEIVLFLFGWPNVIGQAVSACLIHSVLFNRQTYLRIVLDYTCD